MKLLPKTRAIQYEPAGCEAQKFIVRDLLERGVPDLGFETVSEEKFDGVRYQLQSRPNGAKINYLTSRRISDVTGFFVEKQNKLPFIRDHKFPWANTVFDTEMIGKGISSDVCSAIAKGKGHCAVFDITFFEGEDLRTTSWSFRRALLEKLCSEFPPWMTLVKARTDVLRHLTEVLKRGGEGLIIKNPYAVYGRGWWKVIHKEYHDCVIIGFTMAHEKKYAEKGWIRNIKIGQYVERSKKPKAAESLGSVKRKGVWYDLIDVGQVSSGMNEDQRAQFTKNQKKMIGEPIEVSCKQRLPTLKFRSPVFERERPDKNSKDCTV